MLGLLWSVGVELVGREASGSTVLEVDMSFDVLHLGQIHLGELVGVA